MARRADPARPPRPERQAAFRVGLSAENRAAALLLAKGYRIVARRWRSPVGEIDIVARRRQLLVFVEVKARARLDDAAESLTQRQQRRIAAAAAAWLARASRRAVERYAFRRGAGRAAAHAAPHPGGVRDGVDPTPPAGSARTRRSDREFGVRRRLAPPPPRAPLEEMIDLGANASPRHCRDRRPSFRTSPTLARVSSVAAFTRLTSSAVSAGALGRDLDAAGDFLRGGALFGDRRRDRAADIADIADGALDRADRRDRALGGAAACRRSARRYPRWRWPVWPASALTSPATTAKPRPASPARAASMVALSASRLVCSAMSVIRAMTSPMRRGRFAQFLDREIGALGLADRLGRRWRSTARPGDRSRSPKPPARRRRTAMSRTLAEASGRGGGRPRGCVPSVDRPRRKAGSSSEHLVGDAPSSANVASTSAEKRAISADICSWRRCARIGILDHGAVELFVVPHRVLEHRDRAGQRADLVAAVADRHGHVGSPPATAR